MQNQHPQERYVGMDWQEEVGHLFVRLQQIAPRAVKLYQRSIREDQMPAFRRAMEYWECENDKTVVALKKKLGIIEA